MARRRHPVVEWPLTTACILFGAITQVLPLPVCRFLGSLLGSVAYCLIPRTRKIALANLDLAYGEELSPKGKRRIAKAAVRNVGIVAAEFSHMPKVDSAFIQREVTIDGLDRLPTDGVLVISAHIGNWEWMAPVVQLLRPPAAEVVRPMNDPRMDAFIDNTRTACGAETIKKRGGGARLFQCLRDGYLIGVLVDQSPRESAVPVTFFGQPCWATVAPAIAALRAKVPVHTMAMIRGKDGRYTLKVGPALELVRTDDFKADLVENTQRCQQAVEALIREYPEQWLWLHRRWKARRGLEEEWARRTKEKETEGADP